MGAWGIGPFENDGALDWFDTKISGEIRTVLRKATEQPNRGWEETALCAIRCTLMLCADGKVCVHDEALTLAQTFLKELKTNDAYFRAWDDPDEKRREVRKELVVVNAILRLQKIKRESLPKLRIIKRDNAGFPTRIVRKRKRASTDVRVIGRRAVFDRVEETPDRSGRPVLGNAHTARMNAKARKSRAR